jgi:signal transduction histidine kinase
MSRRGGTRAAGIPGSPAVWLLSLSLALLLPDLALGFTLPLLLAAVLPALLVAVAVTYLGGASLRRPLTAVLAALAILLLLISITARVLPQPASGTTSSDPDRADLVESAQADFNGLLGQLSSISALLARDETLHRVLTRQGNSMEDRSALFDSARAALGRAGGESLAGITLYDRNGVPLAWAGQASSLDATLLSQAPLSPVEGGTRRYTPQFSIRRYNRLASRLYCIHPFVLTPPGADLDGGDSDQFLEQPETMFAVSERLLDTGRGRFRRNLIGGFFPPSLEAAALQDGVTLQYQLLPEEFSRAEDDGSHDAGPTARYAITFPDGSLLGELAIQHRDNGSGMKLSAAGKRLAILGALLTALAALAVGLGAARRSFGPLAANNGAGTQSAIAVSAALLLRGIPGWPAIRTELPDWQLLEPAYFSLETPLHLLGSPLDFLASGLLIFTIAGYAALLAWHHRQVLRPAAGPEGQAASGGWLLVIPMSLIHGGFILALHLLVAGVVISAPAEITSFGHLLGPEPVNAVRNGLVLFALAAALAGSAMALRAAALRTPGALLAWMIPGPLLLAAAAWLGPRISALTTGSAGPAFGLSAALDIPCLTALVLFHLLPLLVAAGALQPPRLAASRIPCGAVLAIFSLLLLPALLFQFVVTHHLELARSRYISNQLVEEVARMGERRAALLDQAFDQAETRIKPLAARLLAGQPSEIPGLAYSFWSETLISMLGYGSSVEIFGEEGNLVSGFSYELPKKGIEAVELMGLATPETAEGVMQLGNRRLAVLSRSEELRWQDRSVGTLVLTVTVDYADLSFLARPNPYREMLSPLPSSGRKNLASLGDNPFLTVFDSSNGRIIFSSRGDSPAVSSRIISELEIIPDQVLWRETEFRDGPHRVAWFGDSKGRIFALGYPVRSLREQVVQWLRLLLACLLLPLPPVILLLLLRLTAGGARFSLRVLLASTTPSYYRKILAALLAVVVLPLGLLSFLVTRTMGNSLEDQLRAQGQQSLNAARRLVEDFLSTLDEGETLESELTDDFLIWVSRLVDQDVNIYLGSTLAASSRRELFSIGLLPDRLEGPVYLDLDVRGRTLHESRRSLGSGRYLVLSAPIQLPGSSLVPAVLSTPLMDRQQQTNRTLAQLNGSVLLAFFLLLILALLVTWPLAQRITAPIRTLVQGTSRIAEGHLDTRIETRSRDEIKTLVDAFNTMAENLQTQRGALERRRDYIEKILANAATGVISLNEMGRITTINPAGLRLLGLDQSHGPLGRRITDLLSGKPELATLLDTIERYFSQPANAAQRPNQPVREEEVRIPSADDRAEEDRLLHLVFAPLGSEEDQGPRGTIMVFEDISGLLRANRLKAWTEMSRRIAHEIKNPLTPIQLHMEHLLRVHRDGDPKFGETLELSVDTVLKKVGELRQIAIEFSDFSRHLELEPEPGVDPAAMVREVVAPYESSLPQGLTLRLEADPPLPSVAMDTRLVKRALVNIIENAIQSMEESEGSIEVRVARLGPGEDGGLAQGSVSIAVTDSGAGMDRETLDKLFEPYFSTKNTGTGLGLAIARRTVTDHGGRIGAVSAPGEGTTVTMVLPAE